MDKIEQILSSLPKSSLSQTADRRIRFRLHLLILTKKLRGFFLIRNAKSFSLSFRLSAIAAGILIVFSLTSIYAYASEAIVPGNRLYPLKIAVEKIEEKMAVTPSAKIATYEKLSTRRLEEAVNLSRQKKEAAENIKKNLAEGVKNNREALNSLNKLDEKKAKTAVPKVKDHEEAQLQSLDKIEAYAASKNNQEILEKVKEAKEDIKKREYKKDKEEKIKQEDGQEDKWDKKEKKEQKDGKKIKESRGKDN